MIGWRTWHGCGHAIRADVVRYSTWKHCRLSWISFQRHSVNGVHSRCEWQMNASKLRKIGPSWPVLSSRPDRTRSKSDVAWLNRWLREAKRTCSLPDIASHRLTIAVMYVGEPRFLPTLRGCWAEHAPHGNAEARYRNARVLGRCAGKMTRAGAWPTRRPCGMCTTCSTVRTALREAVLQFAASRVKTACLPR